MACCSSLSIEYVVDQNIPPSPPFWSTPSIPSSPPAAYAAERAGERSPNSVIMHALARSSDPSKQNGRLRSCLRAVLTIDDSQWADFLTLCAGQKRKVG